MRLTGRRVCLRCPPPQPARAAPRAPAPARGAVKVSAGIFDMFKPKTTNADGTPIPHICIDCGWIYQGDFGALPRDFKCPQCNVGKNRFKVYKMGNQGTRAQKRANMEAFRAKRAKARADAEKAERRNKRR